MNKNEDKEIDLLNYNNFKKVFLSEDTRDWMFSILLKSYTDITREELKNAEYVIDENPRYIPEKEQSLITMYMTMDKNRKIMLETTLDRPHTMLKDTSKTFKRLEENNFKDITFLKIVLDKYNAFKTDRPILEFKIRDQDGNELNNFWYHAVYLVIDNFKKITDMENFKKDVVKNIKELADKYDFIKCYQYPKELEKEIDKAIEDDDENKLKELFTKMKSEGATISMIATISDLDYEEVERIIGN